MTKLPIARNTDLVVQNVGKELLLYDLKSNKAYNLNSTSALIYQHCDGKTTFSDLNLKYRHLSDDIIYFALAELKCENLIMGEYRSQLTAMSRRDVLKKVGLASMMALPLVSSVVAPQAVNAQSCQPKGTFLACAIANGDVITSVCEPLKQKCCSNEFSFGVGGFGVFGCADNEAACNCL